MTTTVHVGHPTLRLGDIAPERSPAFSPNLYRWMRRHGHFFTGGGVHVAVYRVRAGSAAAKDWGAGTFVIGAPYDGYEGDTDFSGQRLIAVLCRGAEASAVCNVGLAPSLDLVDGFWDRYLQVGRCAIDPDHQERFSGSDRYHIDGDQRTCLWCGARHQRVLTPRVVLDESWATA